MQSIEMAPTQLTMNNFNSERMKNEKNVFMFKFGDFVRILHARKSFTRKYGVVYCSK